MQGLGVRVWSFRSLILMLRSGVRTTWAFKSKSPKRGTCVALLPKAVYGRRP